MALKELSTKISFNELIDELNNNFDSLSIEDKDILEQLSVVSNNTNIKNLINGNLTVQRCLLSDVQIKIGQNTDNNSLLFNNNGVALRIGNATWSDNTNALVIRVNGGQEIDLTNNNINFIDGRLFIFTLGQLDPNMTAGYNATIKYVGYGDNEATTFVLGIKQPSLILLCTKNDGTDNQTSFIRLTGTGNNDGSNVDQQILNIKIDIKDLQDKTKFNSTDLQTQITQNTTNISDIESNIESLDNRVTNVENDFNSLEDTVLTTNNVYGNFNKNSDKIASISYLTNIISTNSNRYICSNDSGDAFNTYADLINASNFYYGSTEVTPTEHDIVLVLRDETKDNKCVRYVRSNNIWTFQYIVNESPFTPEQQDAIDSGITPDIVRDIVTTTNINNILGKGFTYESEKINSSIYVENEKPKANIGDNIKILALNDDILSINTQINVIESDIDNLEQQIEDIIDDTLNGFVTISDDQVINGQKTIKGKLIVANDLQIKDKNQVNSTTIRVNNGQLEISSNGVNFQPEGSNPVILTGVNDPINDYDVVNKRYVDSHSAGVNTITTEDINNLFD